MIRRLLVRTILLFSAGCALVSGEGQLVMKGLGVPVTIPVLLLGLGMIACTLILDVPNRVRLVLAKKRSEPLGLAYLSGQLDEANYQQRIKQAGLNPEEAAKHLAARRPLRNALATTTTAPEQESQNK